VPTKKVAIVTDSIACLTRELADQYKIEIIPIIISAGGKTYKDGIDITPSDAYKLFLADPDSFNTSAASPADCFKAFQKASKQADNILCVTISVKLSTLYNAAQGARELAKTELPGTNIEIIDSATATPAEGMVALAAARAADEGKSFAEVMNIAEEVKSKVQAIVFLDTIKHVYRSGRIPKIASQVGSALNIKPILTIPGAVHFAGMVRSRKQGIERMLDMMKNKAGNQPLHVGVTHAYAPEEAEKLKERVAAEFNCIEIWLSEFSPVMGYACGTGTVGVAFYPDGKLDLK
jgi:DegV family protein with EDD domain